MPLPTDARTQLRTWLKEREQHPAARDGEPALWLGRRGRLSPRQLQWVVTDVGTAAGLEVSRKPPSPSAGHGPQIAVQGRG